MTSEKITGSFEYVVTNCNNDSLRPVGSQDIYRAHKYITIPSLFGGITLPVEKFPTHVTIYPKKGKAFVCPVSEIDTNCMWESIPYFSRENNRYIKKSDWGDKGLTMLIVLSPVIALIAAIIVATFIF